MKRFLTLILAFPLLWSCADMDYDTSVGIDNEITLFSDKVSMPIGDNIGPLTPKTLFDATGIGDMLKDYVKEDEEGYLVAEETKNLYTNVVMLMSMFITNPTIPFDFTVDSSTGVMGSNASLLTALGFNLDPQVISLTAGNPLTEDISVSGRITILSEDDGEFPVETILTKEFTKVNVPAGETAGEILRVESNGSRPFHDYTLDNLFLHLPASISDKDLSGGMGMFTLDYYYKSYVSLGNDMFEDLDFDINDINLPLEQYRVKEAVIRADVSNEIPITLEVSKVLILVSKTNDAGITYLEPYGDVDIIPTLNVASGSSGNPVVSPLEIIVKAKEGTLPDINGLRLSLSVKAPTGTGDKRLGMSQKVIFNKLRATVSGGITIQSL